jgi:hypothetical protein
MEDRMPGECPPRTVSSQSAYSPNQSLWKYLLMRTAPLAICLCLCGCVERRMTIRTNVDNQGGALAYIDNEEVGTTPVSTGFTYYADREVRLIKDGYETMTIIQPMPAPWWDSLLVEFFVENLWPFCLRDERTYLYEMAPASSVSTEEVIQRGQQLRGEARMGAEVVPHTRGMNAAPAVNF